jgi:hypothetical protein
MQALTLIFVLTILIEGIVEHFATPVPSAYKPYVAAVLAVVVCLLYGADLLAALGARALVPYVGEVLTGLVISRGAGYINTLISRLEVIRAPATTVDLTEAQPAPPETNRIVMP